MKPTILAYLRSCAHGAANAAHRKDLFTYLRQYWSHEEKSDEKLDREMRQLIADTPEICSLGNGYFMPANTDEARASRDYHRKRGLASLSRANRIEKAFPEIAQGELFDVRI